MVFSATLRGAWLELSAHAFTSSDWLINYQGGFVRSGLAGEVLFQLSLLTGVGLDNWIFVAIAVSYLAYFLFAGLLLRRQASWLPFLLLVVSPFVFTFQIHTAEAGYRKEVVYFALLAFAAWGGQRLDDKRRSFTLFVLVGVFFVVVLTHEMLAVFLPYLLAVVWLAIRPSRAQRWVLALLTMLSVTGLFYSLRYAGNTDQVVAICRSLGAQEPEGCLSSSAISWLTRSPAEGMKEVLGYVQRAYYIPYYLSVLTLVVVAFAPLRRQLTRLLGDRVVLLLVGSSLLGSLPLFVVAVDWGRFLYIHAVSLFLLCLAAGEQIAPHEQPPTGASRQWTRRRQAACAMMAVLVIAYAVSWRIPNCCGNPFATHYWGKSAAALRSMR